MKKKYNVKLSTPAILSLLILGVIVVELLASYFFWYSNMQPKEVTVSTDSVVRVNMTGYRKVVEFLDDLATYTPDTRAQEVGSPFIYK